MDRMSGRARSLIGVAAIGACALTAFGAAPRAAQPPAVADPIAQLLVEVHALRLTMEQQATMSPRIQVTLARLSIEEQRISQLTSQLNGIREQLSSMGAVGGPGMKEHVAELESRLTIEVDPAKRAQFEAELRGTKQAITIQTAMQERLRERENDAAQALATEQARWNELSVRLDDLERLMGARR